MARAAPVEQDCEPLRLPPGILNDRSSIIIIIIIIIGGGGGSPAPPHA
jgi:hypothetical protein